MKKVIIIGCGAMGGAILSGCLAHDIWKKEEVSVREHSEEASAAKAKQYGTEICHDLKEAETADLVLIAVKPNIVSSVLEELRPHHPKKVISIAAAVALETLEKGLPDAEIVRVMPNTPASVGEGMTAIAPGKKASDELVKTTEEIFTALGKAAVVTERQLDELARSLEQARDMHSLSLTLWRMQASSSDFQENSPSKPQRRHSTAQPRWSLRQENIRPNSAIRSQARAERRSPVSMPWKREASGPL